MDIARTGIRLLVKDFGTSFDFYTKKLGLDIYYGDRKGPFASFRDPDYDEPCIAILLAKNMHMHKGYKTPEGTGCVDSAVYVIPTDDVSRDYAELSAKGVPFIGKPQHIPEWYMTCAYFRDPDGNLFELCQDDEE